MYLENCIDLSDYMLLSLMELNRDRHLHKHCVCRRVSRQLNLRRMTRRCNRPMIRCFFPCAPHKLGEFYSREKYENYHFICLLVVRLKLTPSPRRVTNETTSRDAD